MKNIFKNKNVLIVGMGKSGCSSLELLNKLGAFCYIFDNNISVLENFTNKTNCSIVSNLSDEIFNLMDYMIISPGVSIFDESVKLAKLYGVKLLSELELGSMFIKGKLIGITGSNGKTTTSCLVYHILKTAKKLSVLCGNIGEPLTENILPFKTNYVVEMSSFQLESTDKLKPKIAAITNITPNHLDRHLTYKNYVEAKLNIFKNMKKNGTLVLNYDDKLLRNLKEKNLKPKVVFVSLNKEIDGFFIKNNEIYYKNHKKIKKIASLLKIKLIGKHNLQNILVAVAICKSLKIKNKVIEDALSTFAPLKHRLQFVRDVNGVSFVNDSKSTSPDSTITAISAFYKKPLILILGGSDKKASFDTLSKKIKNSKNVKLVIVNGATSKKIIDSLKRYNIKNYILSNNFENAVNLAKQSALKGDTILLSPACASFDYFSSFEERGEKFMEIVNKF